MKTEVVIFDLDDTLYKEIDYLKSAYRKICECMKVSAYTDMIKWYHEGMDVFDNLISSYKLKVTKDSLLKIYREHFPDIKLSDDAAELLDGLYRENVIFGMITDGRSITQRNKIKALGLDKYFDDDNIIISEEFGSEKPNKKNFLYFMQKYPDAVYTYIGDNTEKDFVAPLALGWNTVCIKDDGRNIHKQEQNLCDKIRFCDLKSIKIEKTN